MNIVNQKRVLPEARYAIGVGGFSIEKGGVKLIRVTMLTGPYAGRIREMTPEVNAMELLQSCVAHDWRWEIDWSQATPGEKFSWGVADAVNRMMRALQAGRPVEFRDKIYQVSSQDPQELLRVGGELEDAIVALGDKVGFKIAQDDEYGVLIDVDLVP